ncbi:DNA-directed RNA polymerase subunit omega [Devriesea agamarum]|uniref:DNA-directed RNA polymerase subunit omega n=1 Tax=Devriesea agamarum TaxID=472569 RepID=UPI00071DDAD1|nr:DNA-directed RNA polymerase subunit omega [Devriesea agamarum]
MSGTVAQPEGITNPPIDRLLETVDSKYGLVLYSAKRARQINAYYSQLSEGLLEYVGPLVETESQEKPLSIALREIDEGMLTVRSVDELPEAEPASDKPSAPAGLSLSGTGADDETDAGLNLPPL